MGPTFPLAQVSCSAVSSFQPKKMGHVPAPATFHTQRLEGRGMDKIPWRRSFLLSVDSPVLRIGYVRYDKYSTLGRLLSFVPEYLSLNADLDNHELNDLQ